MEDLLRKSLPNGGKIVLRTGRPIFGRPSLKGNRLSGRHKVEYAEQENLFESGAVAATRSRKRGPILNSPQLPAEDNTPEGLRALLAANEYYRTVPWPEPYNHTSHKLHLGDARDMGWIPDSSVHLVVTSPPYWTLKEYPEDNHCQLGQIKDYEQFLDELDKVWRECARILVGGGRICCVVGDVCIPRKRDGRHRVMPLHADIQVHARKLGLDCLTPILWHKIANGVTEAEGNGAGFYGKPYQPGAIIKNDVEYILFLRKGGEYRSVQPLQKALSMLTRGEMRAWQRSIWTASEVLRHEMGTRRPIQPRWQSGLFVFSRLPATRFWTHS